MVYKALVVVSIVISSYAQILLKKGAKAQYTSYLRQYLNHWVISGYLILGASLLINVFCMGHGVQIKEIGVLESLSYIMIPILSYFYFREPLTLQKVKAITSILIGIIIFFL